MMNAKCCGWTQLERIKQINSTCFSIFYLPFRVYTWQTHATIFPLQDGGLVSQYVNVCVCSSCGCVVVITCNRTHVQSIYDVIIESADLRGTWNSLTRERLNFWSRSGDFFHPDLDQESKCQIIKVSKYSPRKLVCYSCFYSFFLVRNRQMSGGYFAWMDRSISPLIWWSMVVSMFVSYLCVSSA